MALMGPSGAGKSTLLDILTMRKTVGIISGEVLMNGHGREGNFLRMSSYVPQEDNFIPTMTTLETLNFYARLVIPTSTSRAQRRRRVDEVLFMVGLDNSRDTMVKVLAQCLSIIYCCHAEGKVPTHENLCLFV